MRLGIFLSFLQICLNSSYFYLISDKISQFAAASDGFSEINLLKTPPSIFFTTFQFSLADSESWGRPFWA